MGDTTTPAMFIPSGVIRGRNLGAIEAVDHAKISE